MELPGWLQSIVALSVAVGSGSVLLTEAIKTVWYSKGRHRRVGEKRAKERGHSSKWRIGRPIAVLANLLLSAPIAAAQWESEHWLVVLIPILAWGVSTLFYRLILKALFVSADSALARIQIRNAQTRNELAQASLELLQAEHLLAEAVSVTRFRQLASAAELLRLEHKEGENGES